MARLLRLLAVVLVLAGGLYVGAKWLGPDSGFVRTIDAVVSGALQAVRGTAGGATEPGGGGEAEAPTADTGARIANAPEDVLVLCMTVVFNAPPADAEGRVLNYKPIIAVQDVNLLLKPATKSCLSSGYGMRNGKLHRGIDYFSDIGGKALAAGDGTIVEANFRADYGNMIVIKHSESVFTRYAHLASYAPVVAVGASVKRGQTLGPIGKTGATDVTHLHFEILTGTYTEQAKSFGLASLDPFAQAAGAAFTD